MDDFTISGPHGRKSDRAASSLYLAQSALCLIQETKTVAFEIVLTINHDEIELVFPTNEHAVYDRLYGVNILAVPTDDKLALIPGANANKGDTVALKQIYL
jgi:hypothetical protein